MVLGAEMKEQRPVIYKRVYFCKPYVDIIRPFVGLCIYWDCMCYLFLAKLLK